MNIYCAGSIKGDTSFQDFYNEIILHVESSGHTALSELNEKFKPSRSLTDKEIFKRDISWLSKSNIMIAEISGASLGVGFEISYSLYKLGIPVLAVYNEQAKRISAMITGGNSNLLSIKIYSDASSLRKILTDFINKFEA